MPLVGHDTDMYVDEEEEDEEGTVVGLPEQPSIPLQMSEPGEVKVSMDAATIIRKLREEQGANDSPSKRLDALAGEIIPTSHDSVAGDQESSGIRLATCSHICG